MATAVVASRRRREHQRRKKVPTERPKALDLFSGCGGLTLGLERAGFRVVGAVEIDSLAVETYRSNHPDVALWHGDIRTVSASAVLRSLRLQRGELELLAGCPPCQGFSRMKTLNGRHRMRDFRNDLVLDFLRFVRVMRPKAVMLENVPGLGRNRRARVLARALRSMGYFVTHDVLDAADYAVPQRRRRFILLAGRGSEIPFAPKARRTATVRDAFARMGRRSAKSDPLHNVPERRQAHVLKLIRLIPRNGGSRRDLGARRQLACHQRCDGFGDVYGRMAWDSVSPTITSGCCNPSKGRFLHPTKNRAITLREAALLQSFPVRYEFSLRRGKFPAAEMIGNALPPEFIRRHALQVHRFLERESSAR